MKKKELIKLLVVGINHSTANIEKRELFSFTPSILSHAISSLFDFLNLQNLNDNDIGVVILSTCNRTEIIVSGQCSSDQIFFWLNSYKSISIKDFESHIYVYESFQAFDHLVRVAGGLDSMLIGEPQIFGQIKSAYSFSKENNKTSSELEIIFQYIFNLAKKVRRDTAIGKNPVSVAYAAVNLAKRIFTNLAESRILLIGAGETIKLVTKYLMESGAHQVVVANRSLDRAQALADSLDAQALLLSEVPNQLSDFDIIISSTASQLPVLGKGTVEAAISKRKHKPMFFVDLAVPRDIEKQVSHLSDVFLYTVDDLIDIIDNNVRLREAEVDKASEIIEEGVLDFQSWQLSKNAKDLVVSYRLSIEKIKHEEVTKAKNLLSSGKDPEEILLLLARALTQRLMHKPTAEMKNAAARNDDELLSSAKKLLGLEENLEDLQDDYINLFIKDHR